MGLTLGALSLPTRGDASVNVTVDHGQYDACIAKFTAAGLRNEVDQLDHSGHTFVVHGPKIVGSIVFTKTYPKDETDAQNGVGTGADIWIDYNATKPYPGDDVAPDGCATLYHEMYHATDDDKGTLNRNDCFYRLTPGGPLMDSHLPVSEVYATQAENRYRATQGLKPRTMYFSEALNRPVDLPSSCEQPPSPPPRPNTGGCNISGGVGCPIGRSYGDPNVVSYNGYSFPFQTVGEFVLTRSTASDFEVQMRTAPVPGRDNLTLNTAVALRIGSHRFAYYDQARPDGDAHAMRFDGKPVAPKDGEVTALPGGGSLLVTGQDAILAAPSGERVTLHSASMGSFNFINVSVNVGPGHAGQYVGILGDASGVQLHDLRTRDGKSVALANAYGNVAQAVGLAGAFPPATAAFHAFVNRRFADSWRVTPQESLFDYAAGTSTQSFTDTSYPRSDFAPATNLLPSAVSTCQRAGVRGAELAGCVSDVTGTGKNVFAAAAAHAQSLLNVPLGSPVGTLRQLIPSLPNVPQVPNIPFPHL